MQKEISISYGNKGNEVLSIVILKRSRFWIQNCYLYGILTMTDTASI